MLPKRVRFENFQTQDVETIPVHVESNLAQAFPIPVHVESNPPQAETNSAQDDLSYLNILANAGTAILLQDQVLNRLTLPPSYDIPYRYDVGQQNGVVEVQPFKFWLEKTHTEHTYAVQAMIPHVVSPATPVPQKRPRVNSPAAPISAKRPHVKSPAAPVPAPIPVPDPDLPQSNFEVLCELITRLLHFKTLCVSKNDNGNITMRVIAEMWNGRRVDAVVLIVNGRYTECLVESEQHEPILNVPWVPAKPNPQLKAQLYMISQEVASFDVTIKPAILGGYMGVHWYPKVGGIVCFTSASEVSKFSFLSSQDPKLDADNPTLAVIKTPNSNFDGVLKTIKKVDGGFEMDGKVLPSREVLLFDQFLNNF
jgi:hypothetical protein